MRLLNRCPGGRSRARQPEDALPRQASRVQAIKEQRQLLAECTMPRGQDPREDVSPRKCKLPPPLSALSNEKRLMQLGPISRPLTDTYTKRPSADVTIAAAAHGCLHERGSSGSEDVTVSARDAESQWHNEMLLSNSFATNTVSICSGCQTR
jgi:hypothetical protein